MRQKRLDLRCAHIGWVPQAVEANEGAAPVHVNLFGAQVVVQRPDALPHPVKQARRFQVGEWRLRKR